MFHKIKINGVEIYRPNDFSPSREDVYEAEIITMTGKRLADIVGWKYADMTLQWDAIPESQLNYLLGLRGACTLVFEDADGAEHTEAIIRTGIVTTATRYIGPEGTPLWSNVNMTISFLDSHV